MNRLVPVLAVALGIAIGLSFPVLAARDASGTFTVLNNGTTVRNPVTAGQVITKDLWNGTFADVGTEMTDSLSRSGKGSMLQPLKLVSGVAATPGLTFSDSTTSGLYYGASTVGLSVSTTPSQTWTAAGTAIPGTMTVTGAANLNGATSLSGGIATDIARNSGSLTVSAPAGVYLDTTAAAQSTGLMTNGVTRFKAFDTYLDANSLNIKNVLDPTDNQDAVTKAYLTTALAAGTSAPTSAHPSITTSVNLAKAGGRAWFVPTYVYGIYSFVSNVLDGGETFGSVNALATHMTLPSGYRPAVEHTCTIPMYDASLAANSRLIQATLRIKTTGEVQLHMNGVAQDAVQLATGDLIYYGSCAPWSL